MKSGSLAQPCPRPIMSCSIPRPAPPYPDSPMVMHLQGTGQRRKCCYTRFLYHSRVWRPLWFLKGTTARPARTRNVLCGERSKIAASPMFFCPRSRAYCGHIAGGPRPPIPAFQSLWRFMRQPDSAQFRRRVRAYSWACAAKPDAGRWTVPAGAAPLPGHKEWRATRPWHGRNATG